MQPTVLITSIGAKVPLLSAVRAAVECARPSLRIIGGDTDSQAIGKYFVDEFWHMPAAANENFAAISRYCLQQKINAIVPTRDGELLFWAGRRSELARLGIAVMVSAPAGVQATLDKQLFFEKLACEGIPAIATATELDELDCANYVVKERFGAGSHRMALGLTKAQALDFAGRLAQPIFQAFIQGQEYSIDLYLARDGIARGAVVRERNLVVHGESQVTTTVDNPALATLCTHAAQKLGLYGHAVFQAIVDSDGRPHLIECNSRFGGASTASLAVGLDSFAWFLHEAAGATLADDIFVRRAGQITMVRHAHDKMVPL